MTVDFQASLFDAPDVGVGPLAGRVERRWLTRGAWVDVLPGWFEGADELFARLLTDVPWRAERRPMYDSVVDVPRLLHTYGVGEPLPHPLLVEAREALSEHYADELGEPFVTAGCCYYRDGRDSVAWHGDNDRPRPLRGHDGRDRLVRLAAQAGAAAAWAVTPRSAYPLGHGDLIVMGGSCQRTWEHAVPKTSRPVGPRISVQFRPRNVF